MSWELKLEHNGTPQSIASGAFSDDGVLLYNEYAKTPVRISLFFTGVFGGTTLEKSTYEKVGINILGSLRQKRVDQCK